MNKILCGTLLLQFSAVKKAIYRREREKGSTAEKNNITTNYFI
jgi:hypothetical protein